VTPARFRYGAAALSALLLAGAFPPVAFRVLAWVALIPWFAVLLRDRGEGHRGPAMLFGLVHFTAGLWWLAELNGLFPFVIASILVLYPLLFAVLFRPIARGFPRAAPLLLPALWVGVDLAREHLLSGFPWLLPGHALVDSDRLRQAADLGGVHLLTFLLVLANTAGAVLVAHRYRREGDASPPFLVRGGLVAAAAVLAISLSIYGGVRRDGIHETPGPRVLLVQPAFPQSIKAEARASLPKAEEMRNRQVALSWEAVRDHPDADLVIWAETMIPGDLREKAPGRDALDGNTKRILLGLVDPIGIVQGSKKRFLGGCIFFGEDRRKRNSAVLVGPEGRIEARFDKEHLTPFGEYLPLVEQLPAGMRKWLEDRLRRVLPFLPDLVPGESKPIAAPMGPTAKVRLGGLICYEVVFSAPARRRIREGAEVLVNLSNYAWYGAGNHDQVLDITRFRAVECRRPVVVATNDGPTAVVDGNGSVRKSIPSGGQGVLYDEVPLDGRWSLYVATGDLFALLCAAAGVLAAAAGFRAGRKPTGKSPDGSSESRENN
jgi:apolipoprotein N-acyltransferase